MLPRLRTHDQRATRGIVGAPAASESVRKRLAEFAERAARATRGPKRGGPLGDVVASRNMPEGMKLVAGDNGPVREGLSPDPENGRPLRHINPAESLLGTVRLFQGRGALRFPAGVRPGY